MELTMNTKNTAKMSTTRYFPILKVLRKQLRLVEVPFSATGDVIVADTFSSRLLAMKLSQKLSHPVKAGEVYGSALLHEVAHVLCRYYITSVYPEAFKETAESVSHTMTPSDFDAIVTAYTDAFPPPDVFLEKVTPAAWCKNSANKLLMLEELILIRIANENPALKNLHPVFSDTELRAQYPIDKLIAISEKAFTLMPAVAVAGQKPMDLLSLLREPARRFPNSIKDQLAFILTAWKPLLGDFLVKLLGVLDLIAEEDKPRFGGGPGPSYVLSFEGAEHEYEAFTNDSDWMPKVVMIAKSTLVWLDQLSKQYQRDIHTLDAIPNEELEIFAKRGFNALWLIGLWERSHASQRIKQLCGNPEAAASAYALWDYEIAGELGGWPALENLRWRAWQYGIRLAADMVPNHTGIDSEWVQRRPHLFIQRQSLPFPTYTFTGENLSSDPNIGIWLEDHYYNRSDCAVVFKRVDFRTGDTRYIYHGNDGTSMPWNDTAQIDFLNPEARQAVIERILHVARNFPIIRFDAAMIMAKRHFRRLWYPEPGHGGDIPSRGENALTRREFDNAMPKEFWREVVDICAKETPDTLLLAEAFWMMEGYFVRTLGMHRVYNSAFMNMLKRKENQKYRDTIKNTQEFDKEILKRFVNFMNNPDEETAAAQFGKGDHYFGVCTLMAALPGLPMFGHGQIEGFSEKYGMEYRRAYYNETPDHELIARHEREIFPLLKKRYLFAGVENFVLYDLWRADGTVDENVFAFSNGTEHERALVLYNNEWTATHGTINWSCRWALKQPDGSKTMARTNLGGALRLPLQGNAYLVMQEQRSGLWYVRNALDIHRNGLGVMLRGFEAQVFLNIHSVIDDERGLYAKLNQRLNGSGTASITDSLLDIEFEELYAAWDEAFLEMARLFNTITLHEVYTDQKTVGDNSSSVNQIENQNIVIEKAFSELELALERVSPYKPQRGMSNVLTEQFINTSEQVKEILEALTVFSQKSAHSEKPGTDTVALPTTALAALFDQNKTLAALVLWYPLVKAVLSLCVQLSSDELSASPIAAARTETASPPGNQSKLTTLLLDSDTIDVHADAIALRAFELWNRLGLSRKTAQLLPDYAQSALQTLTTATLVTVLAEAKNNVLGQNTQETTALSRIIALFTRIAENLPQFKEALGINQWENILWYNKELSERFFALTAIMLTISGLRDSDKLEQSPQEFMSNQKHSQLALQKTLENYYTPFSAMLSASEWKWEELLTLMNSNLLHDAP